MVSRLVPKPLPCIGPYACKLPEPDYFAVGERWTCPGCWAEYKLKPPKRGVSGPSYWRLTLKSALTWKPPHPGHPMTISKKEREQWKATSTPKTRS